jgi:hypothetical protein
MTATFTPVKGYTENFMVNTGADESDTERLVRTHNPYFYQKVRGRKRETFDYHKGCVIASYTAGGTGWSERMHVAYIVCHQTGQITVLKTGGFATVNGAKKGIDEALEKGKMRD